MHKSAILSGCRKYRYALWRIWGAGAGLMVVIGLNPSTADETEDDPTIRRCMDFAKASGFAGLCMVNLFAFRATDPAEMKRASDPVGPDNDAHILAAHDAGAMTVAAWGMHGGFRGRGAAIKQRITPMYALRVSPSGNPWHPLFLPKTAKPSIWGTA